MKEQINADELRAEQVSILEREVTLPSDEPSKEPSEPSLFDELAG